jgi:hypothetical protein
VTRSGSDCGDPKPQLDNIPNADGPVGGSRTPEDVYPKVGSFL